MKTNKKKLRGCCSWRVLPGFGICGIRFAEGMYDVDLLGLFNDFSQQAWSFVGSTAVCSATFPRDLLLQLFNAYPTTRSPPSPLSKPAPRSRLRVLFLVSCVISIYLSINLSVQFSPGLLAAAATGFVCYTAAAVRLAATS